MNNARPANGSMWLVLCAALCAASMWLYLYRVLIPHQVADAAAHGRPRGNLSDLYPRWIGARELLLHGRNPYSPEVTREIQSGYYGRPLDPSRPNDPKDQQGFAYPVYVVFGLAPTIGLPFEMVQMGFFWLLLLLTCAGIPVWLRILRWPTPLWTQFGLILLTLGSLAVMQGLKLRQLTLFVAVLVLAAMVLFVSDHLIAAGVLLALATIKPQLVGLLLLWLALWTSADWRRRYRWLASFLVTMAVLFGASEFWLPHWLSRFWQAVQDYRSYTGAASVLDVLIAPPLSRIVEFLSLAATAVVCWRERNQPANSEAFARVLCLVLAITVLVVPTYAPYNQVLLIPAVLLLAKERREFWRRSRIGSALFVIATFLVAWPWIWSIPIAALSFVLPPAVAQRFFTVPFWTAFLIPVGVAALMLVRSYRGSFSASRGA